MVSRVLAVAAGLGAAAGAAVWAKKNVTFSVRKMTEEELAEEAAQEEQREAQKEELRAAAQAKTESELEAAEGSPVRTALARAKGFVRRHVLIKLEKGGQAPEEAASDAEAAPHSEDPQQAAAGPAADAPAPTQGPITNPVEAAPAVPPLDAEGRLDATRLASPEDFADWDDLGCRG